MHLSAGATYSPKNTVHKIRFMAFLVFGLKSKPNCFFLSLKKNKAVEFVESRTEESGRMLNS